MAKALVLSGGGVSGVAWESGILRGIADADHELVEQLREPGTLFVGTSAGSVVASQFSAGLPVQELFDLQNLDDAELGANLDMNQLAGTAQQLLNGATDMAQVRSRIGSLVRSGFAAAPVDRRAVYAARLPLQQWPQARLLITAVDAQTEALRVFERDVDLIDAITASCAVPLVWPAVEIDGRKYVDGGVRSSTNVDLARGADRVLVLAASGSGAGVTPAESAALGSTPMHIVEADAASRTAFGDNSLSTATRAASAAAGRQQGRRIAAEIAAFWRAEL